MLDKLQLFLKSKIGQPWAYYITCAVYLIITFSGLAIVGWIFGVIWQSVVLGILISILRGFTMGFHAHDNIKCFIISSVIMVIFGLLTKMAPIWAIFLLCLYSCRDIYQKSPIELNADFEGKDEDWHFKRAILIMVIYLISSLILYCFKLYELSKCIMLSLVMVDLMLFKNNKEYI